MSLFSFGKDVYYYDRFVCWFFFFFSLCWNESMMVYKGTVGQNK